MEWKQIEGFNYSICTDGRVRNDKTKRILKSAKSPKGYIMVSIARNGLNYTKFIAQLLMIYFGPEKPSDLHTVNHKNGIKTDNKLDNLEWATQSEQRYHAYNTGLYNKNLLGRKGSKNNTAKLVEEQVLEIRHRWSEENVKGKNITNLLSAEYNVSTRTIQKIVNRDTWMHI